MYSYELVSAKEQKAMPWKNGQGSTVELAKFPRDAAMSQLDFLWRLSVATIGASGPFSLFPGFDRSISLLSGGYPKLVHQVPGKGAVEVSLEVLKPHAFAGEWLTECVLEVGRGSEVATACRDFNVMTRRGEVSAKVEAFSGADELLNVKELNADWHFLYLDRGLVQVKTNDVVVTLHERDILIFSRSVANVGGGMEIEVEAESDDVASGLFVSLWRD